MDLKKKTLVVANGVGRGQNSRRLQKLKKISDQICSSEEKLAWQSGEQSSFSK